MAGSDVSRFSRDRLAEIRNQKIGFVFQSFNLLARMSALENVELPMLYSAVNGREIPAQARRALERVGLADRATHAPSQLSGGQQQRVAIARALVNEPELLLADEPTGNLDTATSVEVMRVFQDLNRQGMRPITHEADIAVARRIPLVRDGQIIDDRPVHAVDRWAALMICCSRRLARHRAARSTLTVLGIIGARLMPWSRSARGLSLVGPDHHRDNVINIFRFDDGTRQTPRQRGSSGASRKKTPARSRAAFPRSRRVCRSRTPNAGRLPQHELH
jgi:putative ABC transport system ATP-binding protein